MAEKCKDRCAGLHLLVAEDDKLNYEMIEELLKMYDISCECAEDGVCCVNMFQSAKEHTYDAIIMDMQMPNMDGVEATKCIRDLKEPEAETIPIIALTTNTEQADVEKCLAAGMNVHLAKPVDIQKLLQVLERFCKL